MKDGNIFAMFFNGGPRKGWNTFKMLEAAKRAYRDEHFEKDLENAKELGSRLVWRAKEHLE